MPFHRLTRDLSPSFCRYVPEAWFVFGDNVLGRGAAGQACIRGLPNAIGLPTKWAPSRTPTAYFVDTDFISVRPVLDRVFMRLESLLAQESYVCWPEADVGTGLAQLPQRAPRVYAYICERRLRLEAAGLMPSAHMPA